MEKNTNIFENAEQALQNSTELLKLKVTQTVATNLSKIIPLVIVTFFFVMFYGFLNISIALCIAKLSHSLFLGFFSLAIFYLLIGVLIYCSKDKIISQPVFEKTVAYLLGDNYLTEYIRKNIKSEANESSK